MQALHGWRVAVRLVPPVLSVDIIIVCLGTVHRTHFPLPVFALNSDTAMPKEAEETVRAIAQPAVRRRSNTRSSAPWALACVQYELPQTSVVRILKAALPEATVVRCAPSFWTLLLRTRLTLVVVCCDWRWVSCRQR